MIGFAERLASLRLTLIALVVLFLMVGYVYQSEQSSTVPLSVPLGLLSINLLAAIATKPQFRRQPPLLVFHLALLAIVVLAAAGRLTYLKGHVEVVEGQEFSGELMGHDAGPLHPFGRLQAQRFSNLGFRITYAPGPTRGSTRNTVAYRDQGGSEKRMEIGDQDALILGGYRFYTTPNKGFAPTFVWQAADSPDTHLGAVHLPSWPANDLRQSRDWILPGTGIRAWVQLQFDEIILTRDQASEFRPPKRHTLVLRIGDGRWELQPGEHVDLPQGRLTYQGLRTWMGYTVFYDWTITWMLAACLLALAAMGWHFQIKFSARPWTEATP